MLPAKCWWLRAKNVDALIVTADKVFQYFTIESCWHVRTRYFLLLTPPSRHYLGNECSFDFLMWLDTGAPERREVTFIKNLYSNHSCEGNLYLLPGWM